MIWIMGLSGSGKTTLCNALWRLLKPGMPELVLLDGDVIRVAFGNDLGYREEDRVVQIRRLQRLAKILSDQQLIVLVAAVYAHPELLRWNRENISEYFEVYLEASLETVKRRDPKGLYGRVAAGEISNLVGVDIPWHPPESPDLVINVDDPDGADVLAYRVIAAVPQLARALEAARVWRA